MAAILHISNLSLLVQRGEGEGALTIHKPVRQPALVDQVFEILTDRITNGTYPARGQLPPENQLAIDLDVSRATLRRALDMLADRGWVRRRQGVGSFVTRIPGIVSSLDQLTDITSRIASHGFEPGFEQISAKEVLLESDFATLLEVDPGSPAVELHKIFTADGVPLIYFVNHIPAWVYEGVLTTEEMLVPGATEPFFRFFAELCGRPIKNLASMIRPALAGDIELPNGYAFDGPETPILLIEDLGYDDSDRPLVHSLEHLAGEASRFELVRRI
jgi:GntR family transcriptional regulator